MAPKQITHTELRTCRTLITNFMCDKSSTMKSYAELVNIFDNCYESFENDPSNDLRILEFEAAMRTNSWAVDVVLTQDKETQIITDGIHRGIAYLRCVNSGVDTESLPRTVVRREDIFGR
jgi:hypothetical protein